MTLGFDKPLYILPFDTTAARKTGREAAVAEIARRYREWVDIFAKAIGGENDVVKGLDPLFATLAPGRGDIPRTPGSEKLKGTAEQGYLHCGPNGAGHFVKMVHNGIEYGLMAAYAEGLGILRDANIGKKKHEIDAETTPLRDPEQYQYDFNLAEITELWRRLGDGTTR